MAILSNNPVTVDGKTYDRLAVSMAISPVFKPDDIGPSVAIRLERYRKDADGTVETLPGHSIAIQHTALIRTDVRIEQMVRDMLVEIQNIVTERGI
jgi:hypothetical protein